MQNPLIWPRKEPGETLDYQIDATTQIAAQQDTITRVSASVSPAGPNEMVVTRVTVAGSFVTVWMTGGAAARIYRVNVQISTGAGRTYEFPIVVVISPDLATYPITPPAIAAFGAPVIWSA
jgi:hypothetical protein